MAAWIRLRFLARHDVRPGRDQHGVAQAPDPHVQQQLGSGRELRDFQRLRLGGLRCDGGRAEGDGVPGQGRIDDAGRQHRHRPSEAGVADVRGLGGPRAESREVLVLRHGICPERQNARSIPRNTIPKPFSSPSTTSAKK